MKMHVSVGQWPAGVQTKEQLRSPSSGDFETRSLTEPGAHPLGEAG